MDYIKYHPLIGGDTGDIDKVPMFASPQKDSVSATSSLYLEEFVPHLRKAAASIVETLPLRTFCKDRGNVVGKLHRKSFTDTGSPPAGTPPRVA